MYRRFFADPIDGFARKPRPRTFAGLYALVTAMACSAAWAAAPVLRVATDTQCAVTLDKSKPPSPGDESLAAGLGAALLGSAADVLVDAGFSYLKTKIDPETGQYVNQVSVPHDGMYLGEGHNPELGCVMVAVFDREQPGRTLFPLKDQSKGRLLDPKSSFGRKPDAGTARVSDRLRHIFSGAVGEPIFYLELVRRYSSDGTGHFYQPIYAFAERMILPHFLSKDPTWQVQMSWQPIAQELSTLGTYRFSGKPPLELGSGELDLQGQGWQPLALPSTGVPADAAVWAPFTLGIQLHEYRSPTLFANALKAALSENEAALKDAARNGYPWRQKELKAAALDKANQEGREQLEAYLVLLEQFTGDCAGDLTSVKKTRCAITYIKLLAAYEAARAASRKAPVLPPGFEIPAPPMFARAP